jgi:cholesterol oxidase
MHTVDRTPLAADWGIRRPDGYDIVIIGSGYGGAILAARLAAAEWPAAGRPSICVLERGKEWLPGTFPDRLLDGAEAVRSDLEPLGLYDFHLGADIAVIQGSGLGGTSLVNANVAYQPDREVFDDVHWPQALRDDRDTGRLQQFYDRALATLHARRHPDGLALSKVRALERGARTVANATFDLVPIAVNFEFPGTNPHGVNQQLCINCGDCVTGCNVGAKNTLDTNYLAIAKSGGAQLFTQVEVLYLEPHPDAGYAIHYTRRNSAHGASETGVLRARRAVVVAAGALGSSAIMLRSREHGLALPDTVGTRFSGNGDFFGIAYNADERIDALGWGAHPESERARRIQPAPDRTLYPGPTIVARARYPGNGGLSARITIEDLSFPLMYVDAARAAFSVMIGRDTDPADFTDNLQEGKRRLRDIGALSPALEKGALNHTLFYLVMGHDDAHGRVELDAFGKPRIVWPQAGSQALFEQESAIMLGHATALGATFIENPVWGFTPSRTLLTAHPLGGCPMGEDHATGLVDHRGRVFNRSGGLHSGLVIADGSTIPTAMGVNPFLTISALAERGADSLIRELGGVPA